MPLELGSDIGGSLRAPAHFCGVFSHKPSLDLIPQRGSGPAADTAIAVRGDMFVIGPMARSAADLALELGVLAGPDEMWDGIGYKLALPQPRHDRLADFRVLVIDAHPLCPTAVSIRTALERVADHLAKLGCTVVRSSPKMPDLTRRRGTTSSTDGGSSVQISPLTSARRSRPLRRHWHRMTRASRPLPCEAR